MDASTTSTDSMVGTPGTASTNAPRPRFKGQAVDLGGTTYIIPPLALGAVRELLPRIQDMTAPTSGVGVSAEQVDTMLDVVLAAMQRNYPDLTRAELETVLDLGNVKPVFAMVLGLSGFSKTDDALGALGNANPGAAAP